MEKATRRNRLIGFVSVLAFVALTNLAVSFVRSVTTGDGDMPWVRVLIELVIAGACVVWVTSRRREHLEPTVEAALADDDVTAERRTPRKWVRIARLIIVPALIAATTVSIADQWGTVEGAIGRLAHLDWHWVRLAIFAEALSVVAFATVGRRLLRAAGHHLRLSTMIGLGLATNSIAGSVPGGPAWAFTFTFEQFRRRGVARGLAAVMVAATMITSGIALGILLVVGVVAAGNHGPAAPFRLVEIAALIIAAAVVAFIVVRRERLASTRLMRRLAKFTGPLHELHLTPRVAAGALLAGLCNWLADCGALVAAIVAVSGHVPWAGLLVVYAVGQIAANLPITPGGVGVTEGAMSLLLIAYGVHTETAVAAVLLYRIISFWLCLPLGWMTAGGMLALQRRRAQIPAWAANRAAASAITSSRLQNANRTSVGATAASS
ncbi:MAG TPA: YbhN family protein [Solirubrobacteraceae bacterium]|nr:YbhN family protein [Solirubrobacteraceae bacterium]